MKQVLNVVTAGLAASICLTVLAACQDGRGQFKSRRSALAERCEWQKANGKASECEGPADPAKPNTNDTPGWNGVTPLDRPSLFTVDPKSKGPDEDKPSDDEKSGKQQGKQDETSDTNPGSAQGHTIREFEKAPGEDFVIAREKFLSETENILKLKDAEVSKLIKGITIAGSVDRSEKVVKISLDAVAVVGGKDRLVNMKPSPVKFESGSTIPAMEYTLREDPTGAPIAKKSMLKITGTCADSQCKEVRVLMEFEVLKGRLWAVFKLVYAGGDTYELKASNLDVKEVSEIPSFEKALENFPKAAQAEEKEDGDQEGKTIVDREKKGENGDDKQKPETDSKGDKIQPEFEPLTRQEVPPIVEVVNNKKSGEAPAVKAPPATFQPATPADPTSGPFKSNAGPSGRAHDNVAPSGGGKVTGALPAAPIQSAQRAPTKPSSVPTARPPVAEPAKAAPATVAPSRSSGRAHDNVAPSGGTPLTKLELPPAPIQSAQPKTSSPSKSAKSSGRPHENVAPSGGKPVQSALGQPLTAVSIEST